MIFTMMLSFPARATVTSLPASSAVAVSPKVAVPFAVRALPSYSFSAPKVSIFRAAGLIVSLPTLSVPLV